MIPNSTAPHSVRNVSLGRTEDAKYIKAIQKNDLALFIKKNCIILESL
jgi:hypothetical protein